MEWTLTANIYGGYWSVERLNEQSISVRDLGPVDVYYNLHKHTFSIRDRKLGRVVGHSRGLVLRDCALKVNESGRQRVLRERRKNVHATIVGSLESLSTESTAPRPSLWTRHKSRMLVEDIESRLDNHIELTYNPYRHDSFVIKGTGEPVTHAEEVVFNTKRIWGRGLTLRDR